MNYKVIDKETYYRKGVFRHFTEDCACSTSMTARIDVIPPLLVPSNGWDVGHYYTDFSSQGLASNFQPSCHEE